MFRKLPAILFAGLIITVAALSVATNSAMADTGTRAVKAKVTTNFAAKPKRQVKAKKPKLKKIAAKTRRLKKYRGKSAIIAAVKNHARAAGVPVHVGLAIVHQESSFNPRARGRAGEIGLMQLKCSTARGMGYRGSCAGLYNVSVNLRYGMRYLRKALKRGSVGYYNAGVGSRRLPKAARKYARQVNRKI